MVKRERLAHPLSIIGFGFIMAAVLVILLPNEKWLKQLKNEQANPLTAAYLEAFLRTKPHDEKLQEALADQNIQIGQLGDAELLIERLTKSADANLRQRTLLLQLKVLKQRVFSLQPGNMQRKLYIAQAAQLLKKMQTFSWDTKTLESVARESRAFDLSALAAGFYKRLAQQDPTHANDWLALAQELDLAEGHYREAALAAFAAQTKAGSLAEKRQFFLTGLKALQSGNLLQLAMAEAEDRIDPSLENDPQTLRFLIKLAQAANRPELAAKYARRLLNIIQSGAISPRQAWLYAGDLLIEGGKMVQLGMENSPPVQVKRVAVEALKNEGLTVDDFELIYNTELSAGNLEQALQVANKALQRKPNDPEWLKRIATVNEWLKRPSQALKTWLILARMSNSPKTWNTVLNLAAGVHDDVVYLEALRHQSMTDATELILVDQIVATYDRLKQPDKALAFLENQLTKSRHRKEILERYAAMAERSGNDAAAFRSYQRLNREFGPQISYALKLANFYESRQNFSTAYDVLIAAKVKANSLDVQYWLILEQAALKTGRKEVAKNAAQHVIANIKIKQGDLQYAITLWDNSPIDAARLAEAAFQNSGNMLALRLAVTYYTRAKAFARVQSLLAAMTPHQIAETNQSTDFLLAKADYLRQTEHADEALVVLREAMKLDDSRSEIRSAYLWLLIDLKKQKDLAVGLRRWRTDAEQDDALWGPYAVGYSVLSDRTNSLHFFRKQESSKLSDPLWQLMYADVIDGFGLADQAWQLRYRVWSGMIKQRSLWLKQAESGKPQQQSDQPNEQQSDQQNEQQNLVALRQRAVSLSQLFAGAEMSRYALMQLLRENSFGQYLASQAGGEPLKENLNDKDSATKTLSTDELAMQEAALAWALSTHSDDLASVWLAQRYAEQLKRPVNTEIVVALSNNDLGTLSKLMASQPDRISVNNRIAAHQRLGQIGDAQKLAFDSMEANPNPEDAIQEGLYPALRSTSLRVSDYIEPWAVKMRQAPLRYAEGGVLWKQQLSDYWRLDLQAYQRNQSSDDQNVLVNVPAHDRLFAARLGWKSNDHEYSGLVGSRQAVEHVIPVLFKANWNLQSTLRWNAALGYNQESLESALLRLGGVKDTIKLGASWDLSNRDFFDARTEAARYYSQDRDQIGSGRIVELSAGHRFHLEYPDFTLRAVAMKANFSGSGDAGPLFGKLSPTGTASVTDILSASYVQTGLLFSFGTNMRENYTRAWRPFMELGLFHNNLNGWQRNIEVGLAGSVLGNDHLMLYYTHARSPNVGSGGLTAWGLYYRGYY